jgi:hypothetical protein
MVSAKVLYRSGLWGAHFYLTATALIFFGSGDAMLAERNFANLSAEFPLGLPMDDGIKSSGDFGNTEKNQDMKPTGIGYYGWHNFHILMRD